MVEVSQQTPSLEVVGEVDDGQPFASRLFREIRDEALATWTATRVDEHDEAWECRWQGETQALDHDGHDPADCGGMHVSIYCSLNDASDHLIDLLTDDRLDDIPFGTLPTGIITPCPEPSSGEADRLFRFYVRALWAADAYLEDLQRLLVLTDFRPTETKNLRSCLSQGAPLDVDTLRGFINTVGKHALDPRTDQPIRGMHCWNHHAYIYFEDTDLFEDPYLHDEALSLNAVTAHRGAERDRVYEAVVMPRLSDLVSTVGTALVNLDVEVNKPEVIKRLADTYGRCLSRI